MIIRLRYARHSVSMAALVGLALSSSSCTQSAKEPDTSEPEAVRFYVAREDLTTAERDSVLRALRRHPVRTLAFWGDFQKTPLEARLRACPPELIDFLNKDNGFSGFLERPGAAEIGAAYEREIREVLRDLPPGVKALVHPKLAGICFVKDLGGSAYTEDILMDGRNPVAAFVVLDVKVLDRPANAWATWRENTPFDETGGYRVAATIEAATGNTRQNAVRYILLHELGHVVTMGRKIHPHWLGRVPETHPKGFLFFDLSWTVAAGEFASVFDGEFRVRPKVRYYATPKARMPSSSLPGIYQSLERTNFVTLYGATSPYDDFAEAFVTYVHAVVDKRPWSLRLLKDDNEVKRFGLCWGQPRCAKKATFLASLLGLAAE